MINIHVDVDNLWIYEQEYNIRIYPDREYIYATSLPLFLKILKINKVKATFMIVGQDLKLPACQKFCKDAIKAGHEIGNHTWSHLTHFSSSSYKTKKSQILKSHKIITDICGHKPVGFRGPGYFQDQNILKILHDLGYQYDSSVLPGAAQLLMKTYALIKGGENRNKAFGQLKDIFSKTEPYIINIKSSSSNILEIPISVLPIINMPISPTFVYYFGTVYYKMIINYLLRKPKNVLYMCHVIDFTDLPIRDSTFPIIPLRISFQQRMNIIENTINALIKASDKPIMTSKDTTRIILSKANLH